MSELTQREIFSNNLKRLIKKDGKQQNYIAKIIGVSPQNFNTWVQGNAIPRMGKVQLLSDYFRVPKSELLDYKEDIESQTSDIGLKLEEMMQELANQQEALMFRGEPMDDETKEAVLLSMQQAMRFAEMSMKNKDNKEE